MKNHSYSDLTKYVAGTENENSPAPKHTATKHKTSGTKTAAQKLLHRKGKKITGIKEEESKQHRISLGQRGCWETKQQCLPHAEGKGLASWNSIPSQTAHQLGDQNKDILGHRAF